MRSFIVACFAALACTAASAQWDNLVPLNDLGPLPYRLGYFGGLYDLGENTMPADHLAIGLELAHQIEPLDANGNPSPDGKIGFMVVGMGDTARIACAQNSFDCEEGSFTSMVEKDHRVNPAVQVVNAALEDFSPIVLSGFAADRVLDITRDWVLTPSGITEAQIEAAWVQVSSDHPTVTIQCACGDAYLVKQGFGNIIRALRARYPNLKIAYLSSRPFAGYSPDAWNVEPFAYETGLSVRWVVVQQIRQDRGGNWLEDPRTGPVDSIHGWAPWIAWGPYLWANGRTPRSDGLTWVPEDYDGEFLSAQGAHKAAQLLFDFLVNEPTANNWFLGPRPRASHAVRH